MLLEILPSIKPTKKYTAFFEIDGKRKQVHFGAKGYKDYIQYSKEDKAIAEKKKLNYLKRHFKNEDWTIPTSPGALSRWVLWNKPSLEASIRDYKHRFY